MSKKTWAYIIFTIVIIAVFSFAASQVAGSCGKSEITFISIPLIIIWSLVTAIMLSEKFLVKHNFVLRFIVSLVLAVVISFFLGKFGFGFVFPIFGVDRNTKNCFEI